MIVVADTSVVLNLCTIGQEELLRALFGAVMIPPEVNTEFQRLAYAEPRFAGLRVPEWIEISAAVSIPAVVAADEDLDAGEAAALALAVERKADAILLDEAAGRLAARALGLRAIGILGILLQAKNAGLIVVIAPVLDELRTRANFWLAEKVRNEVLRLAGEGVGKG